jgi:serine/threonine protein kinase
VDFGFSRTFNPGNPFLSTACGSPAYVAPEIILEEPYSTAADIWSVGVLLYLMVTGRFPFNTENMSTLMQDILTTKPTMPPGMSPLLADLILRLLDKDPETRIALKDIKLSPWIAHTEEGILLSKDALLIDKLRTMDISALDEAIASEMRALGFDLTGMLAELTGGVVNNRTAAYKILMRVRTASEIRDWQSANTTRTSQGHLGRTAGLGMLVLKPTFSGSLVGTALVAEGKDLTERSESARPASQMNLAGPPKVGKFRKRGNPSKFLSFPEGADEADELALPQMLGGNNHPK